jgi:hypothetical protein
MKRRSVAKAEGQVHAHTAHIDRRRAYLCKVLHIEINGAGTAVMRITNT